MTSSNPRTIDPHDIIVEAFRQHGVALSPNDPMLALGTVLEFSLQRAVEEATAHFEQMHNQQGKQLEAKEQDVIQRLEKLVGTFRKELQEVSGNASFRAEQAVKRALTIHPSTRWRDRCLGALCGAILVLTATALNSFSGTTLPWKNLSNLLHFH